MITKEPNWTVALRNNVQINSVAIDAAGQFCVFGSSSEFNSGCFSVYCYNSQGRKCWEQAISTEPFYQGVFWVAISDDGDYVAAGGEFSKDKGFLKAYSVTDGSLLLDVTLSNRVNQVCLSKNGQLLLAVFNDTIQLYHLINGQYQLSSEKSLVGFSCNSCALAANGQRAVISAIEYSNESTIGKVVAFNIIDNQLMPLSTCELAVGSMRVAITDDGNNWGASMHDGSCSAFHVATPNKALWSFKPNISGLELAYGFDITQTSNGTVLLAVGANKSGTKQGYTYLVESEMTQGKLRWGAELDYPANPGISLDKEGRYVTATDGKPTDEQTSEVQESPGNFYLFKGDSGTLLWQYQTTLMNWPMMINKKGDKIIGASDNGSAYFWGKEP